LIEEVMGVRDRSGGVPGQPRVYFFFGTGFRVGGGTAFPHHPVISRLAHPQHGGILGSLGIQRERAVERVAAGLPVPVLAEARRLLPQLRGLLLLLREGRILLRQHLRRRRARRRMRLLGRRHVPAHVDEPRGTGGEQSAQPRRHDGMTELEAALLDVGAHLLVRDPEARGDLRLRHPLRHILERLPDVPRNRDGQLREELLLVEDIPPRLEHRGRLVLQIRRAHVAGVGAGLLLAEQ
jgi:hypothetical protein